MCSDPHSRPPIEPDPGAGASGSHVLLSASDGTRVTAYLASSGATTGHGIIVLPDYHGLTPFYEALTSRFAEAGIAALAIDYYGRTAPPPPRDQGFDHRDHAERTTWAGLRADATAAAEHLRLRCHVTSVFSVGFCFGGRVSFLLASLDSLDMAGVIGFYGWPVGSVLNDTPAPAEMTSRLRAPLLGIFGGADEKVPVSDVETFRQALQRNEVPHDVRVYEGAPHSFFDHAQPDHAGAAADAWDRVRGFIATHTSTRSG